MLALTYNCYCSPNSKDFVFRKNLVCQNHTIQIMISSFELMSLDISEPFLQDINEPVNANVSANKHLIILIRKASLFYFN